MPTWTVVGVVSGRDFSRAQTNQKMIGPSRENFALPSKSLRSPRRSSIRGKRRVCPTFAKAYVSRKRWAQPNDRFCCIDLQMTQSRRGRGKGAEDAVLG